MKTAGRVIALGRWLLNRRTGHWWDLRDWIRDRAALVDLPPDTKDTLCAQARAAQRWAERIRAEEGHPQTHREVPEHGDA